MKLPKSLLYMRRLCIVIRRENLTQRSNFATDQNSYRLKPDEVEDHRDSEFLPGADEACCQVTNSGVT